MTKSRFDEIDQQTMNQLGDVANDAQIRTHQFLMYKAPNFKIGDKIVTDEKWIAVTDEAAMGWCRFKTQPDGKSKVVEEHNISAFGNPKRIAPTASGTRRNGKQASADRRTRGPTN
jgi:hypothetical protein